MANVNQILKYMVSNQLRLIISIIIATVVLVLMQIQYWYGDYGHANLIAVKNQLHEQNRLNQEQINKNNILLADVKDLKSGLSAIEEHARLDLGLYQNPCPITDIQKFLIAKLFDLIWRFLLFDDL